MIVSADHAVGLVPPALFLLVLLYCVYSLLSWALSRIISTFFGRNAAAANDRNSSKQQPRLRRSTASGGGAKVGCAVLFAAWALFAPLDGGGGRRRGGLRDLVKGPDPLLDRILDLAPSISEGPSPPWLFGNRHLQLIPWLIQNEIHRREGIPYRRIELEVSSCEDKSAGDKCVPSSMMNDTITLDIFPPFDDNHNDDEDDENVSHSTWFLRDFHGSSPIILIAPGLRCHSQDLPGNTFVRRAVAEGFRIVVVNRRGHTPGSKLQAPRWSLFGDTADMEQAYWKIKKLAGRDAPLFLHGISSGTGLVVTALSRWDRRRREDPDRPTPLFVASASIAPGYDTSRCMEPDRFLFPYSLLMLPMVKQHFVLQNEKVLRDYDSDAVDAALNARTLQEFADASVPFAGYPNASEYYRRENPIRDVRAIETPKLVINSRDDPCCVIDNLYDTSPNPHDGNKTYAELVSEVERGILAVTNSGSHCPFLEGGGSGSWGIFPKFVRDPLFGGWMLDGWSDRAAVEYYKAALEVYGDRRFM